jgi:hypothetical protein
VSKAVTVITFWPLERTIPLQVQDVVPLQVPLPPRSFVQLTWVMPALSEAVPPIVKDELVAVYVESDVGFVIANVGEIPESLSTSVAVTSLSGTPEELNRITADPLVVSTSSAALKVTVWFVLQFEVVNVKEDPDWILMSESPLKRDTETITSEEG